MTKRIGAAGWAAAVLVVWVLALVAFFVAWALASVATSVAAAMVSSPMVRRAGAPRSPNVMVGLSLSGRRPDPALPERATRAGVSHLSTPVPPESVGRGVRIP